MQTELLLSVLIFSTACSGALADNAPEQGKPADIKTPSITLDVSIRSSSKNEATSWSTSYGSHNKTIKRTKGLRISIRNLRKEPAALVCSIMYLQTFKGDERYQVTSRDNHWIEAPIGKALIFDSDSPEFTIQDDKYVALGSWKQTGDFYAGWLVCVWTEDGKLVKCQGSTRYIEKIAATIPFDGKQQP